MIKKIFFLTMIVCILLFSGCVAQKKEDKLKFKKIEITGGLLTPVFSMLCYCFLVINCAKVLYLSSFF